MSKCLYCPQQLHFMCGDGECCCGGETTELPDLNLEETTTGKRPRGRPMKTEGFTDLLSTGRKRAAKLYAIQPGQICDWAWKKNCGGGVEPIVGCSGRLARDIHHGPDKSVLNNSPDNISVICSFCHNLYHWRNDQYYMGERPKDGSAWTPVGDIIHALSEIEDATKEEILLFEKELGREEKGLDKEPIV